ncbi:MAG: amidase [Burkholderiales bacterium]|nr:amidase [Burkholderiales bacterium]
MPDPLWEAQGALGLARALRGGAVNAEALARHCLERTAAAEPAVRAWAFLDPQQVIAQAREADRRRAAGQPCGALHGLPVGIKDIIDTADMPTENGTVLHAGRRPAVDAALVAQLRAAGAIIFGKTVTTELATYAPGKTRNPHNPAHTPGGSSSGSAAAVAAGMVPLAVGTQTNGSVLRPAAFCGVWGYKPTAGLIAREGVLRQSQTFDQVGVFAGNLTDAALIAETLCDVRGQPALLAAATGPLPQKPRFALMRTAQWPRAEAATRAAVEALAAKADAAECGMPAAAAPVWDWHRCIMEAEIAENFAAEWERGRDRLSASLCAQIERGRAVAAADYREALAQVPRVNAAFEPVFAQYDAIITPAVTGEAPHGLESTGDPAFCTLWTFCGMPALNLPLLHGPSGLPLGVQMVGPRLGDARLLRAAHWLAKSFSGP